MDIMSLIMTGLFIAAGIACGLLLRYLFGLPLWAATLIGLPLSWAAMMLFVWLLAKVPRKK